MTNTLIKSIEVQALDTPLSEVFKITIIDSNLPENNLIKTKEGLRSVEEELLKVRDKIQSDINDLNSNPDVTQQLFVKYDELFALKNEIHSFLVQK
jgi:hypothetical protein